MKAIHGGKAKNDNIDAHKLAGLLRGGMLPMAYVSPRELRATRDLRRRRCHFMRKRAELLTHIQNTASQYTLPAFGKKLAYKANRPDVADQFRDPEVRKSIDTNLALLDHSDRLLTDLELHRLLALLARRTLQPRSGQSWLTVQGQRELTALPLSPIPSTIREDSLAVLHLLDDQIRHLDQELLHRWGADSRVPRLMTIPGIGPFTAVLLILELGAIHRFPSAKPLASYVGLTPRVRASADRVRLGHISKEGNRLLRWALIVPATQATRRPGPLRAWFRSVQRRKGKKVARVALARRLAEIVYQVWKEKSDYFTVLRRGGVRG